jgi:hypothetical protein
VTGAASNETTDDDDVLASGAPIASGLPGLRAGDERELARENRRRKREGLPPIDGKVVPSARGWDEPETPSSSSLAERYVQQRRQTLERPAGDDGSFADLPDDLREDHGL